MIIIDGLVALGLLGVVANCYRYTKEGHLACIESGSLGRSPRYSCWTTSAIYGLVYGLIAWRPGFLWGCVAVIALSFLLNVRSNMNNPPSQ